MTDEELINECFVDCEQEDIDFDELSEEEQLAEIEKRLETSNEN